MKGAIILRVPTKLHLGHVHAIHIRYYTCPYNLQLYVPIHVIHVYALFIYNNLTNGYWSKSKKKNIHIRYYSHLYTRNYTLAYYTIYITNDLKTGTTSMSDTCFLYDSKYFVGQSSNKYIFNLYGCVLCI